MLDTAKAGARIAELRKRAKFTQESLAERLGVSSQAVSKWETGNAMPEVALLCALAQALGCTVNDILEPGQSRNIVTKFMERNFALPEQQLLSWIPRVSRWKPPEGCDMWYSFPAMLAEGLCCIEAQEAGHTDVTYPQLNERFRELMHVTGVGYGFLWNTVKRHIIEELWRVNDVGEMVARVMGYYGRDYIWLTRENTTPEEMRRAIMWSVARGRPVVMEWPGGIPEFNIVTGYAQGGETLMGYTHCEECAAQTNELGMFVNPARWDDDFAFRVLVIGDKTEATVTDRDTLAYALAMLDKIKADDKAFALSNELIAGDKAFRAWLDACDTDENTAELFTFNDIYPYALYQNSIYTQQCVLSFYKKLAQHGNRQAHDIACQITIAVDRITRERDGLNELKKPKKYTAARRQHIENLLAHRECMRGWLRDLHNAID